MTIVLTANEQAKATYALQDIAAAMFDDPRVFRTKDLDEVQTILASRGLQIAAIPKPVPFVEAPATPTVAPATPSKLSSNDMYWVETVIQKYQHAKQSNIAGFNFKNEAVGRLLAIACPILGINFKP